MSLSLSISLSFVFSPCPSHLLTHSLVLIPGKGVDCSNIWPWRNYDVLELLSMKDIQLTMAWPLHLNCFKEEATRSFAPLCRHPPSLHDVSADYVHLVPKHDADSAAFVVSLHSCICNFLQAIRHDGNAVELVCIFYNWSKNRHIL